MSAENHHRIIPEALSTSLSEALGSVQRDGASAPSRISPVEVLFEAPEQTTMDHVVLVRMGRGQALEDTLVEMLHAHVSDCAHRVAITSCAERFNSPQQHSFSALLQRVSHRLGCQFVNDQFREIRERPSMTTFPTAEGRREALQGVMEFSGRLDDMVVLLIDDVTTTGSSLITASEVLVESGAHQVIPIALLRAPINEPDWERNQTKRVIKAYFEDANDVLKWAGATRALKEIATEVIHEQE